MADEEEGPQVNLGKMPKGNPIFDSMHTQLSEYLTSQSVGLETVLAILCKTVTAQIYQSTNPLKEGLAEVQSRLQDMRSEISDILDERIENQKNEMNDKLNEVADAADQLGQHFVQLDLKLTNVVHNIQGFSVGTDDPHASTPVFSSPKARSRPSMDEAERKEEEEKTQEVEDGEEDVPDSKTEVDPLLADSDGEDSGEAAGGGEEESSLLLDSSDEDEASESDSDAEAERQARRSARREARARAAQEQLASRQAAAEAEQLAAEAEAMIAQALAAKTESETAAAKEWERVDSIRASAAAEAAQAQAAIMAMRAGLGAGRDEQAREALAGAIQAAKESKREADAKAARIAASARGFEEMASAAALTHQQARQRKREATAMLASARGGGGGGSSDSLATKRWKWALKRTRLLRAIANGQTSMTQVRVGKSQSLASRLARLEGSMVQLEEVQVKRRLRECERSLVLKADREQLTGLERGIARVTQQVASQGLTLQRLSKAIDDMDEYATREDVERVRHHLGDLALRQTEADARVAGMASQHEELLAGVAELQATHIPTAADIAHDLRTTPELLAMVQPDMSFLQHISGSAGVLLSSLSALSAPLRDAGYGLDTPSDIKTLLLDATSAIAIATRAAAPLAEGRVAGCKERRKLVAAAAKGKGKGNGGTGGGSGSGSGSGSAAVAAVPGADYGLGGCVDDADFAQQLESVSTLLQRVMQEASTREDCWPLLPLLPQLHTGCRVVNNALLTRTSVADVRAGLRAFDDRLSHAVARLDKMAEVGSRRVVLGGDGNPGERMVVENSGDVYEKASLQFVFTLHSRLKRHLESLEDSVALVRSLSEAQGSLGARADQTRSQLQSMFEEISHTMGEYTKNDDFLEHVLTLRRSLEGKADAQRMESGLKQVQSDLAEVSSVLLEGNQQQLDRLFREKLDKEQVKQHVDHLLGNMATVDPNTAIGRRIHYRCLSCDQVVNTQRKKLLPVKRGAVDAHRHRPATAYVRYPTVKGGPGYARVARPAPLGSRGSPVFSPAQQARKMRNDALRYGQKAAESSPLSFLPNGQQRMTFPGHLRGAKQRRAQSATIPRKQQGTWDADRSHGNDNHSHGNGNGDGNGNGNGESAPHTLFRLSVEAAGGSGGGAGDLGPEASLSANSSLDDSYADAFRYSADGGYRTPEEQPSGGGSGGGGGGGGRQASLMQQRQQEHQRQQFLQQPEIRILGGDPHQQRKRGSDGSSGGSAPRGAASSFGVGVNGTSSPLSSRPASAASVRSSGSSSSARGRGGGSVRRSRPPSASGKQGGSGSGSGSHARALPSRSNSPAFARAGAHGAGTGVLLLPSGGGGSANARPMSAHPSSSSSRGGAGASSGGVGGRGGGGGRAGSAGATGATAGSSLRRGGGSTGPPTAGAASRRPMSAHPSSQRGRGGNTTTGGAASAAAASASSSGPRFLPSHQPPSATYPARAGSAGSGGRTTGGTAHPLDRSGRVAVTSAGRSRRPPTGPRPIPKSHARGQRATTSLHIPSKGYSMQQQQ